MVVDELASAVHDLQVYVHDPVLALQPGVLVVIALVHATVPPHASLADAPPCAATHASLAAVLPLPSHSTVELEAAVVIVGVV